jgi:peptide/nickel transport system permease protein
MSESIMPIGQVYRSRSQWALTWAQLRRDKATLLGLGLVLLMLFLTAFGSLLAPYDATKQDLPQRRLPPTPEHPLGLDEFGRDILSRVLVGTRYTLGTSLIAVSMGLLLGVPLGLASGFYGAIVDIVLMRLVDTLLAFPSLLLSIVIVGALGPGLNNAILAVGISAMPMYARVTRGAVLSVKENEYVMAAYALGGTDWHIIARHILPNVMAPIIVVATVGTAQAILSTSALSFIGLGAQPPTPEWGMMLSGSRAYLFDAPHIATFPGIAIVLAMLGFNLLGDGMRDALDPSLRTDR